MKNKRLTNSELQVMEIIWSSEKPISTSNIIELSQDKTWKDSYIHIIIKSLLGKGFIKMDGVELTVKTYARLFAPAITKTEYLIANLSLNMKVSQNELVQALCGSFKQVSSMDGLLEIEDYLNKRKSELK